MIATDLQHFHRMVDMLPSDPPPRDIAAYVDGRRLLPPSTPFPGRWQTSRVEYFRELLEDMSPYSPIQHSVCVAAAQVAKTSILECVAAYYMDAVPSEQLYIGATSDLCERWAVSRLPPLIDSMGFRHKIVAQSGSSTSRRSGDRVYRKEYYGGALDICSAQSAASLRASSKRILLRDEISGCPIELRSGEGDWLSVSEARTTAWANRRKILDLSTPALYGSCAITRLFELGDQRIYKVPCPRCGALQELVMGNAQAQTGLIGEFKEGKLVRAVYFCASCHEPIHNHEKAAMVAHGHWEPTATSQSPYFRSRRISALYSPFITWTEVVRKFNESQGDPERERAFANLYLGVAYKESGSRPELRNVVELRSNYHEAVVQPSTIFLVGGADVQRGSDVDPTTGLPRDPDNPARIELEILGIGRGYRTASVAYKVFEGAIDNPYSGAWLAFNEWLSHGGKDGGPGYLFYRPDGRALYPRQILIDSGDGPYTATVYDFCRQSQGMNPSKGFAFLKDDRKRAERGDQAGPSFFRKWRPTRLDSGQILYTISTNFYKTQLFNNLRVQSTLANPDPPGHCSFPFDRSDEYFAQMVSEEKRSDGSFHKIRARNESLDCRVLCLAAADIFLDAMVMNARMNGQRQGLPPQVIQSMDSRGALDLLEMEAGITPWPRRTL